MKNLWISGLDDLRYLFTSAMLLSLFQLPYLEIKNCKLVEMVVCIEDELSRVKFPNLNTLHLYDLPKLTRFSNFTGNSIDLFVLSKLWTKNCPEIKIFIYNCQRTNKSPRMEHTDMDIEEKFKSSASPFFDEEVIYLFIFTSCPSS